MAVSKVILNGNTLMDVTQKTVTSASMLNGVTALKNDGTDIVGSYVAPTFATQSKTVSPSTSQQTVSPDSGYDGLSQVTVNAMPSGTAGTPTATKGTVSNHSVSVTPSVTNTSGYITGGTKSGTAVTVSASELVSGTLPITDNGTGIDVTNYAFVDVNVSGGGGGVTMVSVDVSGLNRMLPNSPWEYGCLVDESSTVTRDEDMNVIVSCPENSMFVVAIEMTPPMESTGTVSYQEIYSRAGSYYYAVFAGTSGGSIY